MHRNPCPTNYFVDTPGTNAVIRSHQKLTEHFVPRSDLVLFVTSTDMAFSESERIKLTFFLLYVLLRKRYIFRSHQAREE